MGVVKGMADSNGILLLAMVTIGIQFLIASNYLCITAEETEAPGTKEN